MRWVILVAVVAVAACGGEEVAAGDGPPCYEYVLNPADGNALIHCTYADHFCWWTGRHVTGEPERECSSEGAEIGCFDSTTGGEVYLCARVRHEPYIINDPYPG